MKATLARTYKDGSVVKMFSSSLQEMDSYIINNFRNQEELEKYFCRMKKIQMDDGTVDYGDFSIIYLSSNNKYIELPILFKDDYDYLMNMLDNNLLYNTDFINEISYKYPEIFDKELCNKKVYAVANFDEHLFIKRIEENFRKIYNIVCEFVNKNNKVVVKSINSF